MKLSTRARYGTRALLDLAIHGEGEPVSLKDIAKRQQISLQYLEHLMTPLIAAGMVRSVRGPKGGVLLAKSPEDIKLSEIIHLLEGSVAPVDCVDNPKLCSRSGLCVTRDIWDEVKQAVDGVLKGTTLQSMIERQEQKNTQKQEMYYI
jgi:Rrf2 family transcriptional regulator, cysteine metabolism repressor